MPGLDLEQSFLQRALMAGVLAGLLGGILSPWVLLRRMALGTEALSHALFPGLALALAVGGSLVANVSVAGVVSACAVGLCAELLARGSRIKPDVALGILYPLAYAIGLTALAAGKVRIDPAHWLLGHMFGISASELWMLWFAALIIVPLLTALRRPLLVAVFDPEVALAQGLPLTMLRLLLCACLVLAAVSAVHAIGVIPMVALFVAPGAIMRLLCDDVLALQRGAAVVAMLSSVLGVVAAGALDLSAGPCVAIVLGAAFIAALGVRSARTGRGGLARWLPVKNRYKAGAGVADSPSEPTLSITTPHASEAAHRRHIANMPALAHASGVCRGDIYRGGRGRPSSAGFATEREGSARDIFSPAGI
jgi:ABC-type Mn2+/Zn2+ transport system permease subunit